MNKTINSYYMSGRTIQSELFDSIMAPKVSVFIQLVMQLLQFSTVFKYYASQWWEDVCLLDRTALFNHKEGHVFLIWKCWLLLFLNSGLLRRISIINSKIGVHDLFQLSSSFSYLHLFYGVQMHLNKRMRKNPSLDLIIHLIASQFFLMWCFIVEYIHSWELVK